MKENILIPIQFIFCDTCTKQIIEDGYIEKEEKDYHFFCLPKDNHPRGV